MAYSRPVLAGVGLSQNPSALTPPLAGVQQTTLNGDIATTNSLGLVQVGSGLSITPNGVLSAESSDTNFINVVLVNINYIVTSKDSYIGTTRSNITVTLPLGILGRVYYVKNQSSGNIKVQGSGSETLDGSAFQTLGSNSGFMAVFDGARWNIL